MSVKTTPSILDPFAELPDFRVNRTRKHELLDRVALAIWAVLAGSESWEDVELFGNAKADWRTGFLRLPNGIPSHDTLCRVFRHLDPDAFQACRVGWLRAVADALGWAGVTVDGPARQHRASDGKALRHSFDRAGAQGALHLVSAGATEAERALGQGAVDGKSNESTAIPKLLRLLDWKGALVTIDAIACQKAIVADIQAAGADDVRAVKDNQPHLHADIQGCFEKGLEEDFAGLESSSDCTEEQGHGRAEAREVHTILNPPGIRDQALWPGLVAICRVVSPRDLAGKVSVEVR